MDEYLQKEHELSELVCKACTQHGQTSIQAQAAKQKLLEFIKRFQCEDFVSYIARIKSFV